MAKTKLYIARHGKTMFNTIGRAQGWSDSPLTEAGERGIRLAGAGRGGGVDAGEARRAGGAARGGPGLAEGVRGIVRRHRPLAVPHSVTRSGPLGVSRTSS